MPKISTRLEVRYDIWNPDQLPVSWTDKGGKTRRSAMLVDARKYAGANGYAGIRIVRTRVEEIPLPF